MITTVGEEDDEYGDIKHNIVSSKKELDIIKKSTHPNIVRLVDSFESSNHIVIVLEMMDMNLIKFLLSQENKRLSNELTASFMFQTLNGLNYLHRQGIAHNDLKIENILVKSGNVFKICDLGSTSPDVFESNCLEYTEN